MALHNLTAGLYNMSAQPFYTTPEVIANPYCSVPYSSLNAGRLASLPELSPYDCGTCVELCAWDDEAVRKKRYCEDYMVVDSHGTHPNSTEPSNAIYVTPYENNIFNDLKLTAYNVSVAKSVMLGIVEDERCKMVWNGSTLDNGVLPIGKFVDYMVFETWMMRDEGSDNLHNDAGIRKMKKRENDEENEDEKDEEDDIEIGKRGRLCLAHRRERNL